MVADGMELHLLDRVYREALRPEPFLLVSEWADAHRMLPATAAEPGRWRTERTPYLRGIMDALSTGSGIERIVFMKGAQLGATEAGLNWLGYVIAHAPGIALLVQPSLDMAKRNTRLRIDPMIEATPVLRSRIAAPRSRDAGNSTLSKSFPGGALIMTGANSAAALRSTPARYIFLDEIDGFPSDVDGEGDPVALAIERAATFRGRRKILMVSTPTLAGVSRIEKAYLEGDQRRFFVPCPCCGTFQVLTWKHIRWPEGAPERAHAVCEHCDGEIEERHKPRLLDQGEWRATAPGDGRTASFHLPSLVSPFATWAEIATEFLVAKKDPARLQTWVNLKLGEPFEDRDTSPMSPDSLQERAEDWGELLPAGVAVITAGVDVQDDRLEVEIIGWGKGEENWSLAYEIIHGDTTGPNPWAALDAVLIRRWRHSKAVPDLHVMATAIDSGGHRTDQVMRFSAQRLNRRVWAIKGRGGPGVPPWPKRPPKPHRATMAPLHMVGVDTLKHTTYARLRIEERQGEGVAHFPRDRDFFWFTGLVSERPVRKYHRGVPRIEWLVDRGVRNEPLDCRVYATAALHGLYAAGLKLSESADRVVQAGSRAPGEAHTSQQREPTPSRIIRSSWLSG